MKKRAETVEGEMSHAQLSRRSFVGGAAGGFLVSGHALAQLAMPKAPVVLNVTDVAGNLQLTQPIFDNYRKANPNLVSRINFIKGLQPELPGKLKAQQEANRVDIDLVMCGYDGMTGGIDQNLWTPLFPAHAGVLPKPEDTYVAGALNIQQQAKGQGMCVSYSPYGPVLSYMPERVRAAPASAQELMDWCRQNRNRFMYSRPANSGPGRALLAGMPYILGDSDPKDPAKGWSKTWEYMKAIGEFVEYYPAGTASTMKEFGEGSRDLVPVSLGFDINSRVLGVVPKEARVTTLKGFHWVTDGHFMCIPRGSSQEKLPVVLDLMKFLLSPAQQAYIYDSGYNYPGPAVKGVTLEMAPEESQKIIREFGRPEYTDLIANNPQELPLTPEATQAAFRIWDEAVGGAKRK